LTLQVAQEQTHGRSRGDRLEEGERILSDLTHGMRPSQLCAKYGLSRATIYRRIEQARMARVAVTVDLWREQENALLADTMQAYTQQKAAADVVVQQAMTDSDMVGLERGFKMRAEALAGILRTSIERRRVNGTDAPVKAEVTVTHTTPVDAAVEALVAEVEAAS
jgi:transposase